MLVAQISDTHISEAGKGADRLFETGLHLQAAVNHLLELPVRPAAVIVSGDLVDAGSLAEYGRLRALLSPLDMPVYLVPGNHDHAARLREAFASWGYFPASGKLHYTIEDLPVRFVLLDSSVVGASHGELGAQQLNWLQDRLQEKPEKPTVLVLHHPPFQSGIRKMDEWRLKDSDAFELLVSGHPQVERIVCGHLHRPMIRRFGRTVVQVCPSTAHQLALDLADPGDSLTLVMEPPGALLHSWDGSALVTHQICLRNHDVRQRVSYATELVEDV